MIEVPTLYLTNPRVNCKPLHHQYNLELSEVIDHQFVLGWRLHRQVGWLLSFEDAINIARREPEGIDRARSVGDQAASVGLAVLNNFSDSRIPVEILKRAA
jgi:hypothetical protein